MRILGLDPGLNRTGWGVIDAASGRFGRVDSGMIRVPEGELSARLGHIVRELSKVIERTKPDLASAERVFVNVNPQSTLRLGQARGAALVAADLAGLPVEEFTPSEIKEAVCATGRADKPMVQRMIGMLLGIEGDIQADEADALACAVCCAPMRRPVAAAAPQVRAAPGRRFSQRKGKHHDRTAARQAH